MMITCLIGVSVLRSRSSSARALGITGPKKVNCHSASDARTKCKPRYAALHLDVVNLTTLPSFWMQLEVEPCWAISTLALEYESRIHLARISGNIGRRFVCEGA